LPSVNKIRNNQETIREGRPEQMEKTEKTLQKAFKYEGFSSKPSDLIKELLPHVKNSNILLQ
jgi:hypothetical protein